ncbi:MAG: hypothetical protein RLZZ01_1060 [Actinomycetota bacterium]
MRPGESTALNLALENLGGVTERFTIVPAGPCAAWTTVTRPRVTLFDGARDVIEVVVRPPASPTTPAGPSVIAVRVLPDLDADASVVAEAAISIQRFDDRRITVLQPVRRARRRTSFEFMVENHGNNPASCRLHLVDPTARLDGSFDPPAVGVAPGASSLVRLDLKAQRAGWRRTERRLPFEIEATEPDHRPAIGAAALLQHPTISPSGAARLAAAVFVVVACIVAWFGVVRPELRDAARVAVDERIVDLRDPTATTVTATADPAGSPPAASLPAADRSDGEPVSYRIGVSVDIANTRSESLSVRPDARLLLTDVVLQNPNGDLGRARLLRNDVLLYAWDLGAMTAANEFQPRITPIPFEPTDDIVLSVDCQVAGSTVSTGCEVGVLLGGRLLPLVD